MPPVLAFQSLSSCQGKHIKPDVYGSGGLKIGTMRPRFFSSCSAMPLQPIQLPPSKMSPSP